VFVVSSAVGLSFSHRLPWNCDMNCPSGVCSTPETPTLDGKHTMSFLGGSDLVHQVPLLMSRRGQVIEAAASCRGTNLLSSSENKLASVMTETRAHQ
jgi:hypothetical protein